MQTDPDKGLSQQQVKEKKEKYGLNQLQEEEDRPIRDFLSHFWGPIPWMLEIAVLLSLLVQRWEEFIVIATMLLINAGVSFWEERKANNAIAELKKRLSPKAQVLRDEEKQTIDAKDLVPDDIVFIKIGDVVPADCELLSAEEVSVDESALTGESLPVQKSKNDTLFSGTAVKRGNGKAIVVATGADTKFGKTVELVEVADEKSHFQKAVLKIGYYLIGTTLALVALITSIELWRGTPWLDILLFALVLTIAGIPQALPAVLTVTMTVGAHWLAKKGAIVSRLAAMDEVASLEILCADKTGTLTKNELEVQRPVAFDDNIEPADLIRYASLTCQSDSVDPIDKAILDKLSQSESEKKNYDVTHLEPFNPTTKRAVATVKRNGQEFQVAKGAPQALLELAQGNAELKDQVKDKVNELGERGYRSLGVARSNCQNQWTYLGLLPLFDPPREGSSQVLADAQQHCIDVRMVTGDNAPIGRQVARQIGLGDNIVAASEVFGKQTGEGSTKSHADEDKEAKNESEKKTKRDVGTNTENENTISPEDIEEYDGFAEVTPEHKFQLIKTLQRGDRVVGMTGDGINDSPALKQANAGFAVKGATDAAQAAADIVMTEPGLEVITHAIQEARRIFARMKGYSIFRIAETVRILLFMSLSILIFNFYPVTAVMIILLAILNDIPIMTIATDQVITAEKPVRWQMREILVVSSFLGLAGVLSTFFLFWYLQEHTNLSTKVIQSMIFLKLLIAGHFTIYLTRHQGWFWQRPWPSRPLFLSLEATQVLGTLFAVYGWFIVPIGWELALSIWLYSFAWFIVNNAVKVAVYHFLKEKA